MAITSIKSINSKQDLENALKRLDERCSLIAVCLMKSKLIHQNCKIRYELVHTSVYTLVCSSKETMEIFMSVHFIIGIAFVSVIAVLCFAVYIAARHADKKYNKS